MLTSIVSRTIARAATSSRVAAAASARRGYHENIVEHYENPRNVGSLDKLDKNVGTVSLLCYDQIVLAARWKNAMADGSR